MTSLRANPRPGTLDDVHARLGQVILESQEPLSEWARVLGTSEARLTEILEGGTAALMVQEMLTVDELCGSLFLSSLERTYCRESRRRSLASARSRACHR